HAILEFRGVRAHVSHPSSVEARLAPRPTSTMQIPGLTLLRRQLLSRLVRNLAALLGVFQALIAHWAYGVVLARPSAGALVWLAAALALGVGTAAIVPVLQRARRGEGRLRRLAHWYMETGVATMIVGLAVLASWAAYAPFGGIALLLGAPHAVFAGLFRAVSTAFVGVVAAR